MEIFQRRCIPDLRGLAYVTRWQPKNLHERLHILPGLDMYYTDRAQHLTTPAICR